MCRSFANGRLAVPPFFSQWWPRDPYRCSETDGVLPLAGPGGWSARCTGPVGTQRVPQQGTGLIAAHKYFGMTGQAQIGSDGDGIRLDRKRSKLPADIRRLNTGRPDDGGSLDLLIPDVHATRIDILNFPVSANLNTQGLQVSGSDARQFFREPRKYSGARLD